MNGRLHFFRNRIVGILLPLVLFTLFSSTKARAQQDPAKNTVRDEQKLIEKVKEEVMKELLEGDFLCEQIQLGIQDYLKNRKKSK